MKNVRLKEITDVDNLDMMGISMVGLKKKFDNGKKHLKTKS